MTISTRAARFAFGILVSALLLGSMTLAGCARPAATSEEPSSTEPAKAIPFKFGVLPTEDSLPLWVAEDKGYFADAGLDSFEIVVFQSAQERDVAFTSGAIDAFMGDIIAAANLEAGGSPGTILTVMLGADQSQGRFGIVAMPKADVKSVADWAAGDGGQTKPIGTSSATIQEYVLDGLMAEAGVKEGQYSKEEVKKVPVRFELLMAGKLYAAALPEPFLSLAEQGGAKIIADDTKSTKNLSQTILFVSDKYLSKPGGVASADAVIVAWDRAVADVNAAPDEYRAVLVEQARLPKPLETTYKVNRYPESQLPKKADIDAVLGWMQAKGYLKDDVTYEDLALLLSPQ